MSALLSKGLMEKQLSGVAACRNGSRVSHLFFADDNLLFTKATTEERERVKAILSSYEESSSQKINYDKFAILFSSNVAKEIRRQMASIFCVQQQDCIERYLGLPTMVGCNKRQAFRWIKERIA